MSYNYEADGRGGGGERSRQFNLDEADVLYRHYIPVPMEYHLPLGWHLSAAGYAVSSPPPDGPELRSLIRSGAHRCRRRSAAARSGRQSARSGAASSSRSTTSRSPAPHVGRINRTGRCAGGTAAASTGRSWRMATDLTSTASTGLALYFP
jgi:hypothetical protein